jgi:hypothetical protein
MTDQEREQIARDIYERLTIKAGRLGVKSWPSLFGWEQEPYLRAADDVYRRMRVIEAGRIAAGRAA